MFNKCKKQCHLFSLMLIVLISVTSWTLHKEESWQWIQGCLLQAYDYSADGNLKKWDLSVTPEGFFRLRKYFSSGKQEYFSFNFNRLKEVKYRTAALNGAIVFNTIEDDIIVQTYNDPNGNIDSMSTGLTIPVLSLEPNRLDSLKSALSGFKP